MINLTNKKSYQNPNQKSNCVCDCYKKSSDRQLHDETKKHSTAYQIRELCRSSVHQIHNVSEVQKLIILDRLERKYIERMNINQSNARLNEVGLSNRIFLPSKKWNRKESNEMIVEAIKSKLSRYNLKINRSLITILTGECELTYLSYGELNYYMKVCLAIELTMPETAALHQLLYE
jgi:hypothetical protein